MNRSTFGRIEIRALSAQLDARDDELRDALDRVDVLESTIAAMLHQIDRWQQVAPCDKYAQIQRAVHAWCDPLEIDVGAWAEKEKGNV